KTFVEHRRIASTVESASLRLLLNKEWNPGLQLVVLLSTLAKPDCPSYYLLNRRPLNPLGELLQVFHGLIAQRVPHINGPEENEGVSLLSVKQLAYGFDPLAAR